MAPESVPEVLPVWSRLGIGVAAAIGGTAQVPYVQALARRVPDADIDAWYPAVAAVVIGGAAVAVLAGRPELRRGILLWIGTGWLIAATQPLHLIGVLPSWWPVLSFPPLRLWDWVDVAMLIASLVPAVALCGVISWRSPPGGTAPRGRGGLRSAAGGAGVRGARPVRQRPLRRGQ
ncbi:MAG: hypothetical protein ACRDT4_00135 [Micromonosporaceae bacterium]